MKRYLLFVLIFIMAVFVGYAQDSNSADNDLTKTQLLIQKGDKAEARGDFDEAITSYEEAYDSCKNNNVLPLLKLAKLYTKVGVFDSAEKRLIEIPLDRLSQSGQSEVLMLLGKVAIAKDSLDEAADSFRQSLKIFSENSAARTRLALINLIRGMNNRAEELLAKENDFSNYDFDDLRLCLVVDMHSANFGRAFEICSLIAKRYNEANPKTSYFDKFINQPFILFISYLPIFLGKVILIFYFIILFTALGLSASALGKQTKLWHLFTFVFVGVALIAVAHNHCIEDVYKACLAGKGYIYDGVWILPRIIMASHLVAIALFFIFPLFKIIKEAMRPDAYELLGIWLFCFFFGIFVLSFQSNLDMMPRLYYIIIGMFCSIISALIMPLGKLLLFNLSQKLGIKTLDAISTAQSSEEGINFTDAKILEKKIWGVIGRGDISSALALIKNNITEENLRNFPFLWVVSIAAMLYNEDYDTAMKNINNYSIIFQGTEHFDIIQVYEAWIKSEKGDFPVAYKLINAIPSDCAKSMTKDEAAISLLILGRCCLSVKDKVQAHINFNKALDYATSTLLKYLILCDMAELDCRMNAKQAMDKWKNLLPKLVGIGKCESFRAAIESMIAISDGNKELALTLAKKCLNSKTPNGKALFWYGHLLCLNGKQSEAEALLPKMTSGTYNAECLMTEVTAVRIK